MLSSNRHWFFRSLLEFHFCSEPKNYRAPDPSADIRIILNDRLQKQHRQGWGLKSSCRSVLSSVRLHLAQ